VENRTIKGLIMTGGGGSAKTPAVVEEPQVITDDEEEVKKRIRRSTVNTGRAANLLAGIESVLKRKLGE
jgi:hypothetical protein